MKIIILKESRQGMSMMVHKMAGQIYHKWGDKVAILNDPIDMFKDIKYVGGRFK